MGERIESDDLTDREREALHEVELGVENLHRAHGYLVSFHHSTGRAMDHLAVAEGLLREAGHEELADRLRDDHLPRGVLPPCDGEETRAGRWSYDVLEKFQETFLEDVVAFGDRVHDEMADGRRHVAERRQEAAWKERGRTE
ncbi:hypothetical protein DU504_08615 [Haloplanus salinus]|uniref:Uncharacterized protein n=1 Tax=Haloplanus salinus TaxID=1126245 RepID=A0A368NCS3_9EURY|nr:hypothetical protein [Haloplanus salinus]RCU47354.1 hypothetical protein DU504_08615 [Haloplanus salinus]